MAGLKRRQFIQTASAAAGASLMTTTWARRTNPSDRVSVAVIGNGGQGRGHISSYLSLAEAEVVAVCDVDEIRLAEAKKLAPKAKAFRDFRQILDDPSIDAVSIATPDHWHTPAALLALAAGKHVYVEKPCSHNVREGRWLVEAAKSSGKIVQHGTQSRSSEFIRHAIQILNDGTIGDVIVARAWDVQFRPPIGRGKDMAPPKELDYDTWTGPAPLVPYRDNRQHYSWHWWYNFGTGDAGNDGVHEIDIARWGLGVNTHPSLVSAAGGKYVHQDDQEFPDTMTAVFEYSGEGLPRRQLIFEMRLWSHYHPANIDNGNEFLGTRGRMLLTKRGKLEVFNEKGERIEIPLPENRSTGISAHQQNFLDAIRTGSPVNADAMTGHLSSSLPHLANIACRLGRGFQFDPSAETIANDSAANALLGREYRAGHWGVPAVAVAAIANQQAVADLRVEKSPGRLSFFLRQTKIADYVYQDPEVPRPYFCHVRTPSGIQVSRSHPPNPAVDATDHVGLHPGIWLSFGDISGNDYWRFKARTEHVQFVEPPVTDNGMIRFVVQNRYLSQDAQHTICMEAQTCIIRMTATGYRIELSSTFQNDQSFTFGDQEEMGLGLRMVTPLAVNSKQNGRILDSSGRKNGDEVWGKTADWCDYAGPLNNRWVGMTIMSSPKNFRPSWSHARDYGFVAVNPFGRKAFTQGEASQIQVQPGENLTLGFAVEIHETAAEADYSSENAFREFTS